MESNMEYKIFRTTKAIESLVERCKHAQPIIVNKNIKNKSKKK